MSTITYCPSTQEEWEKYEKGFACNSSDIYHCLLDESGKVTQVCTLPSWIEPDSCPVFNTKARKLDSQPCNEERGKCSEEVFWSTNVYKYPGCYISKEKTTSPSGDGSDTVTVVIAVVAVLIAVIAIAIALLVYRRRRQNRKGENQPPEEKPLVSKEISNLPLQEHKETKLYMKTRAFHEGKRIFDSENMVIFVGPPGSGKTSHGLELLCDFGDKYSTEKVKIKIINSIISFRKWKSEPSPENLTCILFDGSLGRWNRIIETPEEYKAFFRKINEQCTGGMLRVVLTVRSTIWELFPDVIKQDMESKIVNLSSEKFSLNEAERLKILESHLKHFDYRVIETDQQKKEKENYTDREILNTARQVKMKRQTVNVLAKVQQKDEKLGFPEICSLFCRNRKYTKEGKSFFENPLKIIEENGILNRAANPSRDDDQRYDYAVFVYIMLKGGSIDIECKDDRLFQAVIEALNLPHTDINCIDRVMLFHVGSRLKSKGANRYGFVHSSILETVLNHFGTNYTTRQRLLVNECDAQLLLELVRTAGSPKPTSSFEVTIQKDYYDLLAERLRELSKEFPVVAELPMFKDSRFKACYDRKSATKQKEDSLVISEVFNKIYEDYLDDQDSIEETNGQKDSNVV